MTGRQVILDTETTGLEPASGHRIIEIGCIELMNRRKTDRILHYYINPEREIEEAAIEIHGITMEQLAGEPVFADIADPIIDFIRDSEVIMHNAPFDVGFINAELSRLGDEWGRLEDYCRITDTLEMARDRHPGQKNSLDALSLRYQVEAVRNLHGALLDAQILLDVYLAMTGGQSSLLLEEDPERSSRFAQEAQRAVKRRTGLKIVEPSPDELAAHQKMLELIREQTTSNKQRTR